MGNKFTIINTSTSSHLKQINTKMTTASYEPWIIIGKQIVYISIRFFCKIIHKLQRYINKVKDEYIPLHLESNIKIDTS